MFMTFIQVPKEQPKPTVKPAGCFFCCCDLLNENVFPYIVNSEITLISMSIVTLLSAMTVKK